MHIKFKHDILNELFSVPPNLGTTDGQEQSPQSPLPFICHAFGKRVTLIAFFDNISLSTMAEFKPSLFGLLTGETQQVIIDLEHVKQCSPSALGALVDFAAAVLGRGKKLYLLAPPPNLNETLSALSLTMFFEILNDHDELLCVLPDE